MKNTNKVLASIFAGTTMISGMGMAPIYAQESGSVETSKEIELQQAILDAKQKKEEAQKKYDEAKAIDLEAEDVLEQKENEYTKAQETSNEYYEDIDTKTTDEIIKEDTAIEEASKEKEEKEKLLKAL